MEDPFDYPFTDSITFGQGSFVVFPGLAEEAVFTVRHRLIAVDRDIPGGGELTSRQAALRLGLATLVLMDVVAKRATLGRGVEPEDAANNSCIVPEVARFASLKVAVKFNDAELIAILRQVRLRPADLTSLVTEAGQGPRPSFDEYVGPATFRPILKVGENYVVVSPTSLLGALRHAVISLAVNAEEQDELAFRYRTGVAVSAIRALERLGRNETHRIVQP
jgi:hypothetical protein